MSDRKRQPNLVDHPTAVEEQLRREVAVIADIIVEAFMQRREKQQEEEREPRDRSGKPWAIGTPRRLRSIRHARPRPLPVPTSIEDSRT